MADIVLASQSPRRQELLTQMGIKFRTVVSGCSEEYDSSLTPEEIVSLLSARKAEDVFDKILNEENIADKVAVIAADTLVALDNRVLGKPRDRQDAFNMLKSLSGRQHKVYTGVTVAYATKERFTTETFVGTAAVKFFNLTDEEINEYINTWEPMDKAGSYGIQGKGAALVEAIEGDYYSIVGLPVAKVYRNLRDNGFI